MKKIKVKMNKSVYLGLSILEISKTLMYKFWYDYIKQKYQNNTTWIQTASLFRLKLKIFIKILEMMLKKKFDTSNYEVDRSWTTGKKIKHL